MNPGDIVLTGAKAQGWISIIIKLGSRLRGYKNTRYSHAALVIDSTGRIAEAEKKGVVYSHVSKYQADDIIIIPTHVDQHDQKQVLEFADAVVKARTKYGFVTFIGLALYCATGGQLCIQQAGTAICSGFVADALTRAGVIWKRPPYACMPADIADHYKV